MIQLGHDSRTHFMNRFPEGTGVFVYRDEALREFLPKEHL
jgi:hypothetical protein